MSRRSPVSLSLCVVGVLAVLLTGVAPVAAEDPPEKSGDANASTATSDQPAQNGQPELKAKTSSKRGNSLADVAGRIKLHKPDAEGGSGIVISDRNLQKVSAKGRISVAGTTEPASDQQAQPPEGAAGEAEENPANQLAKQYQEQKRKVAELEATLESYDKQLAAPNPDPHYAYSHQSPQNRAPGVQDPATVKRDETAKQLEQERTRLEQIRRQAEQAGVRFEDTPKK